jgi:hypothetical protein
MAGGTIAHDTLRRRFTFVDAGCEYRTRADATSIPVAQRNGIVRPCGDVNM